MAHLFADLFPSDTIAFLSKGFSGKSRFMSIESNVWKLQADRFLSNFWVYIAILVPFFESHGLSATQIFLTEAVFATVVAVLDIPTGYLSDRVGRKTCFIIGSALLPVGVCTYLFSNGFAGFALAEAILGIAVSFRSGTDSAFLYDTLKELNRKKEHKRIEGTALFLSSVGSAVANIMGGLLSTISLNLPFIANLATSLILLPLALSMKEPEKEKQKRQSIKAHIKDMGRAIRYCAAHPALRNAAFYVALINGICIMAYWCGYLYYSKIGIPVGYFGFLAAFGSLMSALGSKTQHVVDKKAGEKIALGLPLLMAPSMLIIGSMQSAWAIPLIFLNAFLWGFSLPLLRNILHRNTSAKISATVMSLTSMAGRVVFVILSVAIGKLIDATSIQAGFIALGSVFLVTVFLPALNLIHADTLAQEKRV